MLESEIAEINEFINSCDKDFYNDIYDKEKISVARKYYQRIKQVIEYDKNAYFVAISEKLWFIIRNISIHYKKNKTSTIKPEEALNLVSRNSVTEYVISLIIEKRLTDPKLIARFAYLELSKFVYYDISYSKISDIRQKSIIVNTPINVYNAKIFSYVVCTQWLQLYTYILSQFGIMVKKNNRPGEDHVWGEIDINDNEIIIVDATDFIDNSIDLGNAKSVSPTKGFLIVPKKYSGIKLFDVYSREENKTILEDLKPYYELNRDLDVSLNIIEKSTYPVEEILESNELFSNRNLIINDKKDAIKIFKQARNFILNMSLPNNMDGYEAFAYYYKFIDRLPVNIRGCLSMKTLYVDSFDYRQRLLKKKYLNAPVEYLKYLEDLVYSRYYEYFQGVGDGTLFEKIRCGLIDIDKLSDLALAEELKIAEINRRLNPYYAINELTFYNMFEDEIDSISLLYEPALGKKLYKSLEDLNEFKRENNLI